MASAASVRLGTVGRTVGCAQGSLGLFHTGSLECATAPGGTGGHAVGSDRFVAGRLWSVVGVGGVASDRQMDGYVVGSILVDCVSLSEFWPPCMKVAGLAA